ncbi:hypothetical protein AOQ84DRAFT_27293 [Glonium stellatum]|uniref:Uncharacterized protein n=1 Tax=Glonium stellatum TaxID=574774 RepID=A0A8E2JTS0_9PEZI|nr:hypothetical protein AOQ84DRAFT_27293 [Glonium stellatum]
MSFTFIVHKINETFDKLVKGFSVFVERTENTFQAFNQRITEVEQRPVIDEAYIEKLIRKILAEERLMEQRKDSAGPQGEIPASSKSKEEDTAGSLGVHNPFVWSEFNGFSSSALFPIEFSVDPIAPDSTPSESWSIDWGKLCGGGESWSPHGMELGEDLEKGNFLDSPSPYSDHIVDQSGYSETGCSPNLLP